jgi:HK97 gp10 family phage protein
MGARTQFNWEMKSNLVELGEDVRRRLLQAIITTGDDIVRDARSLVPVREGNLHDSIYAEPAGDGYEIEIGAGMDYAGYVEFGTSRQAAQPYLVPAIERNRYRFYGRIGNAVKYGIRENQVKD